MIVRELGVGGVYDRLAGPGLSLVTGELTTRILSRLDGVAESISALYADFPVAGPEGFADFHCQLRPPRHLRRWYRPQVLFIADGRSVFKPLARHQAFPMLEWGMNWCIARHVQYAVVFHAAAVARNGQALILPAPPGSGKSTLCAALVARGWRLLTDESVLLDPATGAVTGPVRPVSLKNASIPLIRSFASEAVVSEPCRDTLKGTVAHMRPPTTSVSEARTATQPAWLVFPQYRPGAETQLTPRAPGSAFLDLVANSFNYAAMGRTAFHATADLMDAVTAYDFVYSRLDEAVEVFDDLAT